MITRRRMLVASGGLAAMAAAKPGAAETPTARTRGRNGTMEITRNGSQPSGKGPAEYFTGAVRVGPLFQAPDPGRVTGGLVTFEPRVRRNWHTHVPGAAAIGASLRRGSRGTPSRIDRLQSAIGLKDHIFGFDVAMIDPRPARGAFGELDRNAEPRVAIQLSRRNACRRAASVV